MIFHFESQIGKNNLRKRIEMNKEVIVVHYTRNSTRLQVINNTHEKHLIKIREHSNKNNFRCIREFVDKGISGTSKERKAFESMRTFIQLNDVNFIIVTKLSRIMRNWFEFSDFYREIIRLEIGLIAIEESKFDLSKWNDPAVKIYVTWLGLAAELENDWITERRESGRKYAILYGTKSGKPMNRPKKALPDDIIINEWKEQLGWNHPPKVQYFADKYDCDWKTMNKKLKELGLK